MKYHVPTGLGFSPKSSVFYVFVSVPPAFIHLTAKCEKAYPDWGYAFFMGLFDVCFWGLGG
ncbi:MAG: hypothetical protein SO230_05780 [Sodaliphilus sp.]|nr:hypothetical protein [Sodaliphilus sp.]